MEAFDLNALSILLLAGLGGLLVGAGGVAVGAQFPLEGASSGLPVGSGRNLLTLGALVLLLMTALLLVLWIAYGPWNWAPKLVAAGLGFLAGPPLSQQLPGKGLEGSLGLAILGALLIPPSLALFLSLPE